MNVHRYLLLAILVTIGIGASAETLPLTENWALQSSAAVSAGGEALSVAGLKPDGWYPTAVPRTVLAALVDNGVYPDPYYGVNLKSIPGYQDGSWLVMKQDSPFRAPWWYRTEFSVPAELKGREITLHLDGVNYEANVWLNGVKIADREAVRGMFRRFEFPVTAQVRFGEANALAIEIIPPGLIPDKDYDTKQVEATTGWDDHNPQPPDMNMGLWQEVYLRAQGPIAVRNAYVEPDLAAPALDVARLTVSAYLKNLTNSAVKGTLSGSIGDITFAQEVELGPGETREVFFRPEDFSQLVIQQPRVWWPHPVGPQELYALDLACSVAGAVSDSTQVSFGIRKIETYLNDENWRQYVINGRKILIRGGAWMTSDMLLRFTDRRYEALVRYAREAGLNMLRSEGFSIRETEAFYNACDRLGVMATQQIFGRSIPDEALAISCIDDMMLRIRNHPSLVHFLGHDETHPTDTLNKAYLDLIEQYRLDRTYQPHSGTFYNFTRKKTGGTRTGTRELWTYAGPSHYALRKEDGAWGFAQSGGIGGIVAPLDSLRQMMPADQLWPALDTEAWSFHSVLQGGEYFDAVRVAMNKGYGEPKSIEEFCQKAFAMNYNSARGMFEAYGRNKYSATGITTWKYDAAWPAAMTWQYVDWYLRATGAYYGAKKACEALHIQYAYDDESVYVVNSLYVPSEGLSATAVVYNFDMSEQYRNQATVSVGPDGKTKAFTIDWPKGLSATHFLKLELTDRNGTLRSTNFYWLSTTPDIPGISGEGYNGPFYTKPKSSADFTMLNTLAPVKLESESAAEAQGAETAITVTLKNPAPQLAFLVQLAVMPGEGGESVAPVYWEDNYFSLLPGETRNVKAIVPTAELGGERPRVRVSGWNVE